MRCLIIVAFVTIFCNVYSQQDEIYEQQLEDLSESEETEIEDEYNMQQLHMLKKNPVNINDKNSSLSELPFLSALQIQNLITYRELLGDFISVYELQAIPGFSIEVVRNILPFITIKDKETITRSLKQRLGRGEHHIIVRPSVTSKIYFRYKYQFRSLLQYGAVGERDAGERSLIDFYSVHLFMRNTGIIKSLAIGDYTLNLGQGLIHWQSQAFRKSSTVLNIKRQSEVIKPYHSAGEYNFQRGTAITFKKSNYELTLFGSFRTLTANKGIDEIWGEVITSINTSGLHRTEKEIENKNNVSLLCYGGNARHIFKRGHVGFNAVNYNYSLPLLKRNEPYNLFAVRGRAWLNYSMDYGYTYKNIHLFGEWARSANGGAAIINGAMTSLSNNLDLTVVHRSISKNFQSIYGNAFTENTMPSNESGLYMGISIKPHHHWKLDIYADVFKFPWLKYRVDAPSAGMQYLFQLTWKPSRQVEVYGRFRYKSKPLNGDPIQTRFPENRIQENWRVHISYQLNKVLLLRARVENCWLTKAGQDLPETGHILYGDLVYKPTGRWYSGNARIQFFECESYDTRIYAYENDLLFSSSIPFLYNKGMRAYLNMRGKALTGGFWGLQVDLGAKLELTNYKSIDNSIASLPVPNSFGAKFQIFLTPAGKKLP